MTDHTAEVSPGGNETPKVRPRIAVVIPCYKVGDMALGVIERIGPEVNSIYVVDDACPEKIGQRVQEKCRDPRVRVLFHDINQGVGGAVMTGYAKALEEGADIIVKLDGDGQMDPAMIPRLVKPLIDEEADYSKGNRFFSLEAARSMPAVRWFGNIGLSFLAKLSTGYWDIFDPANGFTAINATVLRLLPMEKISRRYFFETDMLFRLNTIQAVVADMPMNAKYGDEKSGLSVTSSFFEFSARHIANLFKRIIYNYYLRDFNIASLELAAGLAMGSFGTVFGLYHWITSVARGEAATAGTVMLAALPVILGAQLILAFLSFDVSARPAWPISKKLK
ncbi:MAG: glycosyltransferase family 2 protein [Nitrospinae bacterium]|nr:glycosyltransferase family 2 protein [Nitrospinota bacterium]